MPLQQTRTILGIDPGTNVLGYGVLETNGSKARMLAMGVIDLRHCKDVYVKLGRIYERVSEIIESFKPDELAIEAPFFGKNVQSMLKLGRAQGVAIAAAISKGLPIHEYAPLKIKMAITGNGGASKEQVALILKRVFCIKDENMLPYLDATDALGAAYCHFLQSINSLNVKGRNASWRDFPPDTPLIRTSVPSFGVRLNVTLVVSISTATLCSVVLPLKPFPLLITAFPPIISTFFR